MTYDIQRVYQHGTLALLIPGLFTGTMTVAELLTHGNFGIGTAHGLAGELVLLEGHAYTVNGDGQVSELTPDTLVPFATVHWQDSNLSPEVVQQLTKADLERRILAQAPLKNLFFAIKITGKFKVMHTRAVQAQTEPYPNLTTATRVQPEFEQTNVKGTLIGYYAPALYQGAAVAGYHVHFLNESHDFGGHILDYTIASAQLIVQPFTTFEQHFPSDNQAFLASDFDLNQINTDIEEAEH
ncbi:acetolactate decarboxylase [Latilactobacillus graminis]|uniref:Alpha-acetolactate decarboxylase n=2 Tax=Latilactobacillus graminis TaxID=60519 RepID=A0AA89I0U4_9LACO|nr:acetolactate decarboxylase [Latilactobacillus graminis]KRM21953.1 alpha-acetolactate decarboxylase [Latilactobacillus graminis DSM 20719]QFP79641.1 acetolactate decarboxylase [Latilactobacillus graminis]